MPMATVTADMGTGTEDTMEREMSDRASYMSEGLNNRVILDDMVKYLVRNWWKFLLALCMVCVLAVTAVRYTYHPQYVASSTFIVSSKNPPLHN